MQSFYVSIYDTPFLCLSLLVCDAVLVQRKSALHIYIYVKKISILVGQNEGVTVKYVTRMILLSFYFYLNKEAPFFNTFYFWMLLNPKLFYFSLFFAFLLFLHWLKNNIIMMKHFILSRILVITMFRRYFSFFYWNIKINKLKLRFVISKKTLA